MLKIAPIQLELMLLFVPISVARPYFENHRTAAVMYFSSSFQFVHGLLSPRTGYKSHPRDSKPRVFILRRRVKKYQIYSVLCQKSRPRCERKVLFLCMCQIMWPVGATSIWVWRFMPPSPAAMGVDDGLFTLHHRAISGTFLQRCTRWFIKQTGW